MKEIPMTLCFLTKEIDGTNYVCLPKKKRGFRTGKITGYGGKLEPKETIEQAMARELYEESTIADAELEYKGTVKFYNGYDGFIAVVHIFVSDNFATEPQETEEMEPAWYPIDQIPYEDQQLMSVCDEHWMPPVLEENKNVQAEFFFNEYDNMTDYNVNVFD